MTLAEILAARGYSTAGVSANYGHLSPAFGLTQGFQHWEAFAVLPFLQPKWFFSFRCALKPLLSRLVPERNLGWMEAPADYINRRVVSSLEKLQSARGPFFLFVNYMDAHHPYIAPRPFDALFHRNDLAFRWTQYDDLKRRVRETQRPPSQRLQQHLISKYDGSVAYLDSQLGALFKRLKNLGLYDRCLLIVTADHGETFGRRNLMGHVVSVYQDQVHVPLVIKYPGVRKKTVVNAFVSHVDLMPTILDAVGLPIPKGLQGRSLIRPELGEKRLLVAEHFEILRPRGLVSPTLLAERAMFDNTLKLICSTDGKQELYDLSRDPDEYENLYRPNDPTVKRLEESLDRWVTSAPKSMHLLAKAPGACVTITVEALAAHVDKVPEVGMLHDGDCVTIFKAATAQAERVAGEREGVGLERPAEEMRLHPHARIGVPALEQRLGLLVALGPEAAHGRRAHAERVEELHSHQVVAQDAANDRNQQRGEPAFKDSHGESWPFCKSL